MAPGVCRRLRAIGRPCVEPLRFASRCRRLVVANRITKARVRRTGGGAARAFDRNRRQAEGRKQRGGDDFAEHAHGGVFRKGRRFGVDLVENVFNFGWKFFVPPRHRNAPKLSGMKWRFSRSAERRRACEVQEFSPPSHTSPRGPAETVEKRQHEGIAVQRGGCRVAGGVAFDTIGQAIVLVTGDKSGASAARFYRTLVAMADKRFDARLAQQRKRE